MCTGNEGGSAYPPPGTLCPIGEGASAYLLVEREGLMPHGVGMCLGTERILHNIRTCGIQAVWGSTFLGNVETGQGP